MCLYPRLIYNPKYKSTKKNGGVIPPITDERVKYVPIGCGKCMECKKQKANHWRVRLLEDIKTNTNATFVTLTFSNESFTELSNQNKDVEGYALDNYIVTRGCRLFLERWRKEHKKSLRHWLVTELGHNGTENVHLHGIVWSKDIKKIERIWKYGYCYFGNYVNSRTINYIVKYVTKTDIKHKHYNPIILTSAGIGAGYTKTHNATLNKYTPGGTKESYTTSSGHKTGIPIYWRNKLYTEQERELLWIEKLDKGERWVNGQKITNESDYWKALEQARKLNKKLGYGSDENNWEQEQYEKQMRILKHSLRRGNSKDIG